ncbi:caspase family protein [Curvivirga sp.]|uniref:caspase family protein n=1 Tax=Curvivirga sp. TaxID=2856848 RepID=UPI003B5BE9ED
MTRIEYNNWDTSSQVKILVSKDWYVSKTSYFGAVVTGDPVETYKKLIEECHAFFAIVGGYNQSFGKCALYKVNDKRAKYENETQFRMLINTLSPIQTAQPQIALAEPKDISLTPTQSTHTYRSAPNAASIAVIIGNQDYRTKGQDIPDVTPAQNDGLVFKKFAMENLGILEENIIHLNNATKADLARIFGNDRTYQGRAYNWVREGRSDLYVYYAGHGAPGPNGEAYLVPVDATADTIHLDGYPLDLLYKNLSQINTKSTTVILESCFSGNSNAGTVIRNASPVFMNTEETTIPPKLNVITAGSTNQLASWTKNKENGLFTYHYIKGMKGEADGPQYGNEDGQVSMSELQAYMDDTVTYWAKRYYNRKQNVQITVAR